jgi:hypothetical protein
LLLRPFCHARLIDVQNKMVVITHHRKSADIDREDLGQLLQSFQGPCLAMGVVLAGVLIEALQPGTAHAACDDVVVGRVVETDEELARVTHECYPCARESPVHGSSLVNRATCGSSNYWAIQPEIGGMSNVWQQMGTAPMIDVRAYALHLS